MEQIKLLSLTTVLTVLIWASADSLVNESVIIHVKLDMVPSASASNMLIELASDNLTYEVEISGPRGSVEAIQEKSPLLVRYPMADLPTGPATQTLSRAELKQRLVEQWSEFSKLTIVGVRPEMISIKIDHWVNKEVNLTMNRLTHTYEAEPQLQRSTIQVRMRESLLQQLPADQHLQLDIASDFERLIADYPAGENATITIPLHARSFGVDATLTPRMVEVSATIKPQYRVAEISTVPILVAVSFPNLEKPYRALTRDGAPLTLVTQTIKVTGPAEEVARLETGATRAFGVIHLKQTDLDQLNTLRLLTPEYYLPEGIKLSGPPTPIELQLTLKK